MHLIVYTSEYVPGNDDIGDVLSDIVKTAKARNPGRGITGLLFYHNHRFIQFIEGKQHALEELMAELENDPRHCNIERIIDQSVKERGFKRWNMDTLNLSDLREIDPEELNSIRDAYKHNMLVDSEILAGFYKAMLEAKKSA